MPPDVLYEPHPYHRLIRPLQISKMSLALNVWDIIPGDMLLWESYYMEQVSFMEPSDLEGKQPSPPSSLIRNVPSLSPLSLLMVGVVEIRFVKPSFKYLSGQWLWLNIPSLSHFQWHPFTITSSPSDEYISLHIRCVGDWTDDLATRVGFTQRIEDEATSTSSSISLPGLLKINVDGPFGAPAELVYRQNAAICVGSGIGITPWASVLKNIWSRSFVLSLMVGFKRTVGWGTYI